MFLTVDPIGWGEAQVAPRRREELRLATAVEDVTVMVVKFPVEALSVEAVVTPALFLKLKTGVADDVV